jgi:CRP-like cAMP-binding protein
MTGGWGEVAIAALLGLATTSSSYLGAIIGLYAPLSKRVLAGILAFAAGALICALAIELAFQGAQELRHKHFGAGSAWIFIGGGFAIGAIIYYLASRFLEKRGAAVRYPTRFREYALERKQEETKELIQLLSKCDLLRHLPPQEVEWLLPCIQRRHVAAGEIVFRAGDPADALYIVAKGRVEVRARSTGDTQDAGRSLAELGPGSAFGEMALLRGGPRSATIGAIEETDLLEINRKDFEQLLTIDPQLAQAVQRLSHQRAIENLSAGGPNPEAWASVASSSLDHLSRAETNKLLTEAGIGAGLAILFGNILDTIPGCLVIGSKFSGLETLSITLAIGMFLGGIPEAAASGAMLRRAGYRPAAIFRMWSTVIVVGVVAAAAGKLFIGSSGSLVAIFAEAVAAGAVLALVSHAMIPEAIHEGGSLVVLPTVAGFLFAFYLALSASFA